MRTIWATRGRTWGFRFLLDGGFADPLPTYDRFFSGLEDEQEVCRHVGEHVAVRFPDPLDRRDGSGRIIPHDFVVLELLADDEALTETINSVDDGIQRLWPFVSEVFRQSWDAPKPPDATVIRSALRLG